ncbi:UDP:flavonoid glycosyltransferase YjiC (YdhE family) [Arthrobacter ginsengisoli]|uniref:UDP:flavonoid glycosyltransferase YjiC (YdhE family) n=1 Tax=Arthrobacter ginsengisoli TaxID=1356565 RepID=A0ABU1UH19_9MICC|nr:nucleotide disphospho-sugar-binding domain-containing protein [Arthrobacter ginsengisoli]MDR7084435.1 UDP:flavonoid glycosyltransferase YjiC (YdhE family) [Arthrobacter ginsengisoli]
MKILLASQAIAGHFNPMTGIAVRLRDEGHEVGWYTGRTLAGKLGALGIRHYPFDRAIEHTGDNLNELYPQRARLKGPMAIRFDGERIFASNVTSFFEDIRDVHQCFPFDAVVMDNSMFIQRLVAVVLGKPVVSVVAIANMESDPLVPPMFFGFTPARTPAHKILHAGARLVSDQFVTKPARTSYVRQLQGYGLSTRRGTPITDETYRWSHAVIQTGTASLDFPRRNVNPKVHYVGALLPHRAESDLGPDTATAPAADARQATASDRSYARTVVVTQGTVDNRDPAKLMIPTIEALKDTDTRIIVATGGRGTDELRRRYPLRNVVVEDYVDFARVFPSTDVFVTNGGFGGVLLSLSHGVPLVTAGLNEGKSDVNARVEYAGVGVNLKTETPSSAALRSAVDTVLGDPSWRARAQAMRGQFEVEDSAGAAVEVIKAVVATAGTRGTGTPDAGR